MRPDERPPPESFSFSPRRAEKLVPVPEPYLNRRASRTQRSMIPPSLTRSSATDWMKQACGCGMLVGRLRLDELAGLEVDVIMALARPIDAIGPVQAGVEPLRRIGRGDLARQHEAHLVVIGARVVLAVEIAGLPAPIGPGAGEPVEHLLGGGLRAHALVLGQRAQRRLVGDRAPQERGNALLLDPLQPRGDAGFAEIFLRQHVGRDLAPGGREPRCRRAKTRPSRRDCGSRSWWSRRRRGHKG